jgi:hypothetical protein
VPVRKSFADWLLFRRIATVRRRLFGADSMQAIPAAIKQRRLPDHARAAFLQIIDHAVQDKIPALPTRYSESLLTRYVAKFRDTVLEQLRVQRDQLAKERTERQGPFDANQRVLTSLAELKEQAAKVLIEIDAMAQQEAPRSAATEPALLPSVEPSPVTLEYSAA